MKVGGLLNAIYIYKKNAYLIKYQGKDLEMKKKKRKKEEMKLRMTCILLNNAEWPQENCFIKTKSAIQLKGSLGLI